jgi:hypothetical protein
LNADLFRTSQDLAPGDALKGIAEGTAAKSRQLDRIVSFEPRFRAQLQADGGITADIPDGFPKREELLRAGVDLFLIQELDRQSCLAQYGPDRNPVLCQPLGQNA